MKLQDELKQPAICRAAILLLGWVAFSSAAQTSNSPPVLPPQIDRTISSSSQLVVTNTAVDPDVPSETLTYQLINPPAGAEIDAEGIIRWKPTGVSAPSTNLFTTVVTDDSVPPLSATNGFTVVVLPGLPVSGLIGWWPGEGDASDLVGLHPGALVNSVGFTNGLIGQAFVFNGQNDYLEIPNSTDLNPQTFTIEAWVHPLEPQLEAVIVAKGGSADPSGMSLQLASSPDGTLLLTGTAWGVTNYWSSSITLTATNPVPVGQWTHLAMTLDYPGVSLYVNGKPDVNTEATPAFNLIALTNSAPLTVGGGNGLSFNGWIDEVLFYNRGLSADEIQDTYALMNAGGPLPPVIFSPPQGVSAGIGTDAQLSVMAFSPGAAPLYYQWLFNGNNILGATNSTLNLQNVQPSDSGPYSVLVTNVAGAVTTKAGFLSVAGVIAWTAPNYSGDGVPAEAVNVVAVAAGCGHNLALRADGSVVAWGFNVQGQCNVPVGLSNVVAIAADGTYSLALKDDGQVVGWGMGPLAIPSLTNVIAIATEAGVAWALQNDGTAVGWDGSGNPLPLPADWTNLVAIAAGPAHALGLRADGTVVAWGDNEYGQTNVPADLTNVVAISANLFHSAALQADGTVVAWGSLTRDWGLTNIPPGLSNVVAIAAGETFNLVLLADGTVVQWGVDAALNPIHSPNLPNTVRIAAGCLQGLALLRDGAPQITVEPWDREVLAGNSASLQSKAVGRQAMSYQWQFYGKNIAGATNDTYTVVNAQPADAGSYSLVASNAVGMVSSRRAKLVVAWPLPALSIVTSSTNLFISWPSAGTSGFVLEECGTLAPGQWVLSPLSAKDDGSNKTVTVSQTIAARFFRLRK